MDGLLPVYKPAGMSSFDVIRRFKKITKFNGKLGHAGTLDVFASGVLILMLGSSTKQFDNIQTLPKTYTALARLGVGSNTLDPEGELVNLPAQTAPALPAINDSASIFVGKITQEVPAFSAAKFAGKPMYEHARKGVKIEKVKEVIVYSIEVLGYVYPLVSFTAIVSAGTYIRQLSYDIFHRLGVESFLVGLERAAIGDITIRECATLKDFANEEWKKYLILKTAVSKAVSK